MTKIKAIEARLNVANIRRTAEFYAEVLGFQVQTMHPKVDPEFAILERDGLRLQFTTGEASGACTLYLDVSDALSFHSSVSDKVNVEWGPEVYFYHRREFGFKDPDGHVIIVSEATDDAVTDPEQ